jgi:hypothetical protein
MAKGPSSFCLGYFSFSKTFNHIAKNASILHFKLGDYHRPSYFLTSTLYDTPPISTANLLQAVGF